MTNSKNITIKIYYQADTDSRKFEGRTQLARSLKHFLVSKGAIFVDNPQEADILHFHSSGIFDTFKAAEMKKKYNKPCIYSLYSVCHTELWGHIKNRFLQRVYFHKTATNAFLSYSAVLPFKMRAPKIKELDVFITLSNYVKKRSFPNTKVIRAGVDTEFFKPRENEKDEKNKRKIKVAFFGHPTVQKGLFDFIKASKQFSRDFETYVFPTKMTPKIAQLIKKHNPHAIIGGLQENMSKIYNDVDIVVLPYRSKISSIANPLVLLEAMACGKAIITTNLEFITELVQGAAITVDHSSPDALAASVQKLHDERFRSILGKKARQRISEEFSQEKMFQEYLNVYRFFEQKIKK
jgi:glycosyltransferase involved in cell wall biosynthesis